MDNKSMMQLDGDLDTQFDDLVNYCMLSGRISQHLYEEYRRQTWTSCPMENGY